MALFLNGREKMNFGIDEGVHDPFASLSAKSYMSLAESVDLSRAIGRRITRLSPRPELVVGIANGGILPAIVAAEVASIDCEIVRVRRKSSRIKQRLAFLGGLLRLSPKFRHACERIYDTVRRVDRTMDKLEDHSEGDVWEFEVANRHVVIVDDCVHSGCSVAHVRRRLLANGAASVQIAVISWAMKHDSQAVYGVRPDIHLHRIIHYYPWTIINPDYCRFAAWLKNHGYQLWK